MPEPLSPPALHGVLATLLDAAALDALPAHLRLALASFVVTYNLACLDGRAWGLLSQLHTWRQTREGDGARQAAVRSVHGRWN